jgi:hypothetical protein
MKKTGGRKSHETLSLNTLSQKRRVISLLIILEKFRKALNLWNEKSSLLFVIKDNEIK